MNEQKIKDQTGDVRSRFNSTKLEVIRRATALQAKLAQTAEQLKQFNIDDPTHINLGVDYFGVVRDDGNRLDMDCAKLTELLRQMEFLRSLGEP